MIQSNLYIDKTIKISSIDVRDVHDWFDIDVWYVRIFIIKNFLYYKDGKKEYVPSGGKRIPGIPGALQTRCWSEPDSP